MLYRWQKRTDTLQVLRDDLPAGRGSLLRGLTVHDDRVYLGIPALCERCVPDNDLAGTVVSVALDGSDLQVEARGLRFPAALTVYDGLLWVSDTAPPGERGRVLDELNQIDLAAGTVPHFGWPHCNGLTNRRAVRSNFNCDTADAPAYALHTGSVPLALEPYAADLFPHLRDELLLVLAGAADSAFITGYEVVSLETWHSDNRTVFEVLLPLDSLLTGTDRVHYDPSRGYRSRYGNLLNRRGAGTWPLHPYDVAVSPAGWLYISAGSQIYALRPAYRDDDICTVTVCRSDSSDVDVEN
jgi:glucose/arabinose dehydrogenase